MKYIINLNMLEPVPFVALVIEHVLGLARFAKFTEEPGVIQAF